MAVHSLLRVLFLVCIFPMVHPCLQCDRVVRYLHEDFLGSVAGLTVQDQIDLKTIIDHAYVTYQETSQRLHGVIDPTTLYRARTEYQSEFQRYWQDQRTDTVQMDMIKIVDKGRKILEKHLEIFIQNGLCPNNCGLLYQSVMNCSTCHYGLRTCLSATHPQDCGEHQLEGEEGDQVVLDCFLPWHSLVVGQAEYHYSWKPGAKNSSSEGGFQVLVVTTDSKIVLSQLRVDEQGVYRCLLQDSNGTVLSSTHFMLTVTALPPMTPGHILTLPSLAPDHDPGPAEGHPDSLLITMGLVTALSLTACLTIILGFGVTVKRKREDRERRRRGGEEEGENVELMTLTE